MTSLSIHPARTGARPHAATPATFVALTFALSWTAWIGGWLATGRPDALTAPGMTAAVYLGSFGPGLAAAILSWREKGAAGLRTWAGAFVKLRAGWRAYAALLALPIAIVVVTALLGYRPRATAAMPAALFWLTLFPVSLFNAVATVLMGAGPLGEEGGWRGWLLPRLLERHGEARAAALVGVIWALWHLPIMALFPAWRGGLPFAFYLPAYVAGVIGLSLLMTRLWRLGGGSLVPCIWLHGLVNAIGATAFAPSLWTSRWSAEASTAHNLTAFWIAAAAVWLLSRPWAQAGSTRTSAV